jgi:spermidine synthase
MSDHLAFVNHVVAARAGHILITGLGLGMVVQAMLLLPWMQRVDVIETDSDVIALVAGHYRDMAARVGVELRIHHGDAYSGVEHFDSAADRFDAVWHDIWPTIGSRNVVGMDALIAHYAPLVSGRQMCWCEDECRDFIAYLMAT